MFSKIFLRPITFCLLALATVSSCKKDSFTQVDMNDLNPDVPYNANTPLDQWLKTNFLDLYNSDVIYRYNRFYHEQDRNITPIDAARVQPFMQTVLSGFADPYVAIAGLPFMKVNMPKQWILYGSSSYSSTTVYWGNASGGVRVNIFDLNTFSENNATTVRDRLGTIHHEFTHILNQRVIMPVEFPQISKARYTGSWESISTDSAQKVGFMRGYSMQNPTEDFADMVKYPVVWGPSWFDNVVRNKANTEGAAALRAKEQSVLNYYNTSLNMDFRDLQKRVQLYLKNVVKDPEVTFPYWINQGLYKTVTYDPSDPIYNTYGTSAVFTQMYNDLKTYVTSTGRTLNYIQLRFNTPTSLVVRVAYTSTAQFLADYDFSVTTNASTGVTTFTKVAQSGTTGTYANAAILQTGFTSIVQPYLTTGNFIADWIPVNTPPAMYTKTGGFTKSDNSSNYFYGTLGQVLQ